MQKLEGRNVLRRGVGYIARKMASGLGAWHVTSHPTCSTETHAPNPGEGLDLFFPSALRKNGATEETPTAEGRSPGPVCHLVGRVLTFPAKAWPPLWS